MIDAVVTCSDSCEDVARVSRSSTRSRGHKKSGDSVGIGKSYRLKHKPGALNCNEYLAGRGVAAVRPHMGGVNTSGEISCYLVR